MPLTITDQRPAVLNAVHTLPINGNYDPMPALREMIVDPLFVPLPNRTVMIKDDQGKTYDADDITSLVARTLAGTVDQGAERDMKSLLRQGLITYDASASPLVNEVFAVQAGTSQKMPAPSPTVIYNPRDDVIPAAKTLLGAGPAPAGGLGTPEATKFFASLAYTYSPETLGFWFLGQSAYDDFRTWFDQEIQVLAPALPGDTISMLTKFQQLTLPGLTESLILRKDDGDQLQDYSFARVLLHLLMRYMSNQQSPTAAAAGAVQEAGALPFVLTELVLPRTVVLVNVEAHARATTRKVDAEWKLINASLNAPVKIVNAKSLSKLTALPRALAKAASQAANARTNQLAKMGRAARVKFRKQPPNSVDIMTGILRVLKRMKEVNRSQNVLRKVKSSFLRANRRHPDDYNMPGRSVSTHYLPDLHIYCDTSGSISEVNYQESVMMLIRLAKKLNVNLYFNSFSHVMSTESLLHTANKSVAQIWKEFQKIAKVTGATDYEQIWHYVNASPRRRERLSVVITDFEWRARSQRVEHPKNLYYAPCGHVNWASIMHHAEHFMKSVEHIEPAIAQHLIGII